MCLMGCLSYSCYLLLCKVFHQKYSPVQRLLSLFIVWGFYFIPLPLIVPRLSGRLSNVPGVSAVHSLYTKQVVPASKITYLTDDGKTYGPIYSKSFLAAVTVWLVILVALILYQIYKYHQEKKKWISISKNAPEEIYSYIYGIAGMSRFRKIQIRIFPSDASPFVIGYVRPLFFLPQSLNPTEKDAVIRHELYHISHWHNGIKLLGLLAVILHWYCPVVFCFFISLGNTLEMVCDKKILANASESKRNSYVQDLISWSVLKNLKTTSLFPASSFKGTYFHITKERILMIKHGKQKASFLALLGILVSVPLCTLPVLAYQPPFLVEEISEYSLNESNVNEECFFVPLGEEYPENYQELEIVTHFGSSDSYFESENGEIYYDYDNRTVPAVNCKHTFITGYYHTHKQYSDGSCNSNKYKAERCKLCGYVKTSTLINSVYSPICPH